MRVLLDGLKHYEVREEEDRLLFVEYGEECPGMGERDHYLPSEGKVIASFQKGQKVEIIWGRAVCVPMPTHGVVCGDDIVYEIRDWEEENS